MDTVTIFVLGFIGALAPEIVRLYTIRKKPRKFRWTNFYITISVLFACLGGILALILPATTQWGAFYAGLSTPIVVNSIAKKGLQFSEPEYKGPPPPYEPLSAYRSYIEAL